MKLIVYQAATPNDAPHMGLGTRQEVDIPPDLGTPHARCQALLQQFPNCCVSLYDTSDSPPGWVDVSEDTIHAVSSAVQARPQLRIFKAGALHTYYTSTCGRPLYILHDLHV